MKIWYKLHTPDKTYLLRCYGAHTVVVSVNGMSTAYKYTSSKPIIMTLQQALQIVKKGFALPYYKHVTKVCRLEVIINEP